jgi:hypothetical protein
MGTRVPVPGGEAEREWSWPVIFSFLKMIHHQMVTWELYVIIRNWLYSVFNQNRHSGRLVERTGLFFRKVGYSNYDVAAEMFQAENSAKVMHVWIGTSTPPYAIMAWCKERSVLQEIPFTCSQSNPIQYRTNIKHSVQEALLYKRISLIWRQKSCRW